MKREQTSSQHLPEVDLNNYLRELADLEPEVAVPKARSLLADLPATDLYNQILATRTLGAALVHQGLYAEAQPILEQALKNADVHQAIGAKADCLNHLALCAYYSNRFETALTLAYQGLDASRDATEYIYEADALQVIGLVHNNFGLSRDALESFLAELSLLESHGVNDKRKIKALNAAGVSYTHLSDFAKAKSHLESSLALARQKGDLEGQALALRNLGSVADEQEEHEKALALYEQSFELYEQIANAHELACQYLALGKALANLARYGEARSAFTQVLVYLQHVGNASLKIDVSLNLSQLAHMQGDTDKAHERLCDALQFIDEEAAPADAFRVHKALADSFKQRGDSARALHHFELFHDLKERVQKESEKRRTKGLLLQFDVKRLNLEKEMYRLKHVELASAYDQLKDLSTRDPLTSLYNRRHLSEKLSQEAERARRYERPLSIMLCDIDDFKAINDSFGHQVGDRVLIEIAKLLQERTRASDIVARYGGEEIVTVFPETELKNATKTCEGILASIRKHSWSRLHPDLSVTLSIGLAELSSSDDIETLLRRADNKMYEAKRSGKNRVCS